MAKETKFITVSPSEVELTIEMWQIFGWELFGAPQEVYNKHQEFTHSTSNADHYRTETTHYVKITFQREKSMPHYDELSDLEQRYYSLPSNIPEYVSKKPKRFGVGGIILIVLGLCIYVVPGVIIIVYKLVTYPRKLKKWEEMYLLWESRDEVAKERADIIKRAKSLTA